MNMRKCIAFFTLFALWLHPATAQSTAYVLQGGLTMGTQRWDNNFSREPLFAWHGALAIESVNNEDDNSAFFAQFGYHIKGSATRFRFLNINNGLPGGVFTERFEFRNLSMTLGAKQKFALANSDNARYYYFGGLRTDYTLSTNIDELASRSSFPGLYPFVGFMNRWMFGLTIGGGLEWQIRELLGLELKFSVCPDLTLQYNQPPINNVIVPGGGGLGGAGQTINIEARRIRNTALEFGVGLRLLRKVEYVD
jgi:hypothetical protein